MFLICRKDDILSENQFKPKHEHSSCHALISQSHLWLILDQINQSINHSFALTICLFIFISWLMKLNSEVNLASSARGMQTFRWNNWTDLIVGPQCAPINVTFTIRSGKMHHSRTKYYNNKNKNFT